MGTSVSMRSPRTSRPWAMARAQIGAGAPPETLLTDVIRAAADEWLAMLTSAGIKVYARSAADASEQMIEGLTDDERHAAVTAMISEARTRALTAGGAGIAVGLAERAFARTLLLRLHEDANAVNSMQQHRGVQSTDLVTGLLTELMRQSAMHFFARDAAAYTGTAAIPDVQTFNTAARRIGDAAANSAGAGRRALRGQGVNGWAAAVRAAMQSAAQPKPNLGT